MGPHHLDALFSPQSAAVFGASDKEGGVGTRVFLNMVQAGFKGELYPVNPKHDEIHGYRCYKDLEDIDAAVDLAARGQRVHHAAAVVHADDLDDADADMCR